MIESFLVIASAGSNVGKLIEASVLLVSVPYRLVECVIRLVDLAYRL